MREWRRSGSEEKRRMGVRRYGLGVRKGRSRKDKEGKRRGGEWVGCCEKVQGMDLHGLYGLWYNQEKITKKNRRS